MTKIENIPAELAAIPQWVCYMMIDSPGKDKPDKVPVDPHTLWGARPGDPDTWSTLETAAARQGKIGRCKRQNANGEKITVEGELSGVGFMFHGNGIVGIDFDHCYQDGQLTPWVEAWVHRFDSYTEFSPSGTGLHILCKGKLPGKAIKRAEAELYDQGRYFTVTGQGPQKPLRDAQEAIDALYSELDTKSQREQNRPTMPPAQPVQRALALDDMELTARIKRSKNGALFSALWAGDTSAYDNDDSRADMALCDMLAFWTGRDAGRMDQLFRQSGLMREKWDRPTAGSTYGAITIADAIASATQVYDPQAHFKHKSEKITTTTATGPLALADLHPEKNDRYAWTDIGNGYLFADWYKDRARYVPDRKKWFVYDGKRWRPDIGDLRAMELCKKLADALAIYALSLPDGATRESYRKFVDGWQRRAGRERILKDAAGVYPVEIIAFDADPNLFNCLNGTLDLRTRSFRPHAAGDMLSKISGVAYDPNARCERWERFISEVMEGDMDKAAFLQKAMGLTLTGTTDYECFFLLYGPKSRNGKGTTMETFMRLMGEYGRTAKPDTIAQRQNTNSSAPSEDIARLAGARFVNISEPDKRLVLSAALVKTLTGRDTINARFLNENSFDYMPQFKMFVNTNHLPAVTDVTLFSSGRVKVIPFERHFGENERDQGLKGKLARPDSLSGILNWCLDGLWLLRETGFETPAAVLQATEQYRQDSDKISRFIADEMEAGAGYEVRTAEAFTRYQIWCSANGFREGSIKSFNADMENAAVVERRRPKNGGEKTTLISGYRLRPTQAKDFA